ncbi:MAG: plasmid pRiA4b ORF-3 family protein [Firmicutes bacterium]|nr:plasmid pRiA4b ORF-3 family protein [Bacillota bacterium]
MRIGCTKKLVNQLNIQTSDFFEENPFFSWHANIIKVNGKNSILLLNNQTKYAILLYQVYGKDFKKLTFLIQNAIRAAWKREGVKNEIINQYLILAKEIIYTPSSSRSVLSSMHQVKWIAENLEFDMNVNTIEQVSFSLEAAYYMVKFGNNHFFPHDLLYTELLIMTNLKDSVEITSSVFREAFEMKVSLIYKKKNIWRKLVVPSYINFEQLHFILQVAFGWENRNDHSFLIFDQNAVIAVITAEGISIQDTRDEKDTYHHLIDYKTGIKEYFSLFEEIQYMYDFEIDFVHIIQIEKTVQDMDYVFPFCKDGFGTTPEEENDMSQELSFNLDKLVEGHKNRINSTRMFNKDIINKRLKETFKEVRRF